ncbi:MAG TPA: class I SAM-dependent methyltransferase [Chloroflexota bacterium]|nr:class I SAM-dependent methyltransferase [Chloroflexota bacterium]
MNSTIAHPELHDRRGDYGFDVSTKGLLPAGLGGLLAAGLATMLARRSKAVAVLASGAGVALLSTAAIALHTTRRGKFAIWAELLDDLPLRGDEQVLDTGCGRGAVLAMVAKLLPHGHAVGLDLWTSDQSGNHPEATRRNLELEGVSERCEIQTGDMLAMPFPDASFDLVVSSMAIHNIDERAIWYHKRRLQALDEAVRVLKPGGRMVITDVWSSVYAQHLRTRGLDQVQRRPLGWRFWYGPWLGAGLVMATKPAA